MKIKINGAHFLPEQLACREPGFGTHLEAGKSLDLLIEMELKDIPDDFINWYDEFVLEIAKDDLATDHSASSANLVDSGYANFAAMTSEFPGRFCALIHDLFPVEFLESFLGKDGIYKVQYAVSDLRSAEFDKGLIRLAGTVFAIRPSGEL